MQITLPKSPKIKEEDRNRAILVVEELYPGYGVTIGNALRRVLYSSLPGAAITQVKIKGAPHEFSTLKGVQEDVLEVILNLKQIAIKLHGDEAQVATIKVKGAKNVTASDIIVPSQLEVISKDAHIATLTSKDAAFEAELVVEPGLGYVAVEQRQKKGAEIGSIPLDAIFTPVKKVNFEVENMRVGERTDFNRLNVEVMTDGTISPREAFAHAADLLVRHFSAVGAIDLGRKTSPDKAKSVKSTTSKKSSKSAKSSPKKKPASKKKSNE